MADSFLPPAVLDMIVNAAEWNSVLDEATEPLEAINDLMAETSAAAGDMAAVMGASAGEAASAVSAAAGVVNEAQDAMADGAKAAAEATAAADDIVAAAAEAMADSVTAALGETAEVTAAFSEEQKAAAEAAGDLAAAQSAVKAAAAGTKEAVASLAEIQAAAGKDSDEYAAQLDVVAAAMERQSEAAAQLKAVQAGQAAQLAESEAAAGAAAEGAAGQVAALGDAQVVAGKKAAAAGDEQEAASAKASKGLKLWGLAAVAGVAISVKMAGDFQQSMTRLVTSAGETKGNLGLVSQGILAMSVSTNTSTSQLASGMYQVESAGFHGAAGLTVLKAAAQGAQAEGADLGEVANAVTSGLNAYGLSASHATAFTNQMVTTVGQGKMTMQDLASSLSNVLPIASKFHISFAQVGGALATMTSMGVSARQGTQDLAATIRSLGNPTGVAVTEMGQFGISSTNVASKLGQRGLSGTISYLADTVAHKMGPSGLIALSAFNKSASAAADAKIMLDKLPPSVQGIAKAYLNGTASYTTWNTATKGLGLTARTMADQFATVAGKAHGFNSMLTSGNPAAQTFAAAMSKMLGGATGLNVGLMLTGSHAKAFDGNVKAIAGSAKGAGANVKGWSDIQGNFNFQLGSAEKAVQAMAISFGTVLLPGVTKAMRAFAEFGGWLAKHTAASKALAVVIGVLLAGALTHGLVKALGTCVKGFQDVTGAGGKVLGFFKSSEGEASQFSKFMGGIGNGFSAVGKGIASAWSGTMTFLGNAWSGITGAASSAGSAIASAWSSSMTAISSAASAAWSGVVSGLSTVGGAIASAASSVAEFAAGVASQLAAAAAATGAWIAEHAAATAAFVAENLVQIASAVAAFVAENAATLGIVAGIALLVGAIVWLATHWKQVWHDICAVVDDAVSFVKSHWKLIVSILTGTELLLVIKDNWGKIEHFVMSAVDSVINFVKAHWKLIVSILGGPLVAAAIYIADHWHEIEGIFSRGVDAVISWLKQLPSRILGIFSAAGTWLLHAGEDIINGLVRGVEAQAGAAIHAVEGVGNDIIGAAKDVLGIFSPSREFASIGEQITSGLSLGITRTSADVLSKARTLAADVARAAAEGEITSAQASELSARLSAALRAALHQSIGQALGPGLRKELNETGKITKASLIALQQIWDAEKAGLISFSQASGLAKWVKADNARLVTLSRERNKIAGEIAAAKAYASSTAAAAESTYSLTAAAGTGTTPASVKSIISTLKGDVSKIRRFATNIKKLAKEGLNKAYLSQIIAMGPDQGGPLAAELAAAGLGQIKAINAAESQITAASNGLGYAAGNAMYDSGKQAGKGFLSGLKAQEKAIEKVMAEIAASMVKRLRKDLGISSPSRVFFTHGLAVAQGLAMGIASGAGQVARAMGGLSAAASLAGTRSAVPAGVLGSASSQTVVIQQHSTFTARVDRAVLFEQQQEETFHYNVRNSGRVTGAVRPGTP